MPISTHLLHGGQALRSGSHRMDQVLLGKKLESRQQWAQTGFELSLAEGVGFEPTESCPSHAFEACPFGRSGTLPGPKVNGYGDRCHQEFRRNHIAAGHHSSRRAKH